MGKREGRGDREGTKGSRREGERERGGEGERVFHVSPEFERPPFHVSIVIFSLFSFHLPHLSSRDKDITVFSAWRVIQMCVHSPECRCA